MTVQVSGNLDMLQVTDSRTGQTMPGQTCTSTFRLPLTEAARMIAALAEGTAAGLVEPPYTETETPSGRWNALLGWVRRQFPRPPNNPQTGLWLLK